MTYAKILDELRNLTNAERLAIIEASSRLIRDDLKQETGRSSSDERKRKLTAAAEALLPDYEAGGELTIFTSLDGMVSSIDA